MKHRIILLTICFAFMVPIGTLTHELGHVVVARYYNYSTTLSYASMHYEKKELTGFRKWLVVNKERLKWDTAFVKKHDVPSHQRMFDKEQIRISFGGPVLTFLIGLFGLLVLLFKRKRWLVKDFKSLDWAAFFMSLFFSRFVFNAVMHFALSLMSTHVCRGDEEKIAIFFGGSPNLLQGVLLVIFSLVLYWIVFIILPSKHRKDVLVSALIGCTLGWLLWMELIGKLILP